MRELECGRRRYAMRVLWITRVSTDQQDWHAMRADKEHITLTQAESDSDSAIDK